MHKLFAFTLNHNTSSNKLKLWNENEITIGKLFMCRSIFFFKPKILQNPFLIFIQLMPGIYIFYIKYFLFYIYYLCMMAARRNQT